MGPIDDLAGGTVRGDERVTGFGGLRVALDGLSYIAASIGGVLLVTSAFLPWRSVTTFGATESFDGLSAAGDGWITFLLGLGIFVVAIAGSRSQAAGEALNRPDSGMIGPGRWLKIIAALGALAVIVMLAQLVWMTSINNSLWSVSHAQLGFGVYIGLLGGLLAGASGIVSFARRPR